FFAKRSCSSISSYGLVSAGLQSLLWELNKRLASSHICLINHKLNIKLFFKMNNSYYEPRDLKKFEDIDEFGPELAEKFFDYYGAVFEEGALSGREKALIALAVSHTVQC